MSRYVSHRIIILSIATLIAVCAGAALRTEAISATKKADVSAQTLAAREGGRLIQIAICLDTSGSMDGLIESAKQKLWAVVNDLGQAEPTPKLEVALLTYGNDSHVPENGWVKVDSPFTVDLDDISERLFALTTNGGSEYVARVLHKSESLQWDPSEAVLKIAVVAGNESANQDPQFSNVEICSEFESRGILINSIYCGPSEDTVAPSWRDVAVMASGTFATIDHNDGLVVVESPFDKQLAVLSTRLNETYIPTGSQGESKAANQMLQDSNAASLGVAAEAARSCTKASKLYSCSSWDLVDAVESGKIKLEEVEDKDLPADLRGLPTSEKAEFVEAKRVMRKSIQSDIVDLGKKRDQFIRDEISRQGLDESRSFDAALRGAIRKQAETKGFVFPSQEDTASSGDGC